jgi:DNA-binding response OmpR family regulator
MAGPRVLVVLDDPLAKVLELLLQHGGYESRRTTNSSEFSRIREEWTPHIAMLDLDLHPEFLRLSQARDGRRLPTLVFTRRRETALKLHAFEEGADDVLRVPFLLSEIIARLYAVMRRTYAIEMRIAPRVRLDSVEVDLVEERLHVHDREPITLTLTESTLLYLLAANAGNIVDRDAIVTSIWDGVVDIESNAVDRHIRDLRIKLGDTWPASRFIETIPGKGYRWRHVGTRDPN